MQLTKRAFLKSSAYAGIGGLCAAQSRAQAPAPGRVFNIGFIGTGRQGMDLTRTMLSYPELCISAVCDIDTHRRSKAQQTVNAHYAKQDKPAQPATCRTFNDYRNAVRPGGYGLVGTKKDSDEKYLIATKDGPAYQALLTALQDGKKALAQRPRMDMPGAVPIPQERNFGKVF